jgi:NAD(P)-dependent dehydrogenase (short-subunit alcohol dehydrogenase family)
LYEAGAHVFFGDMDTAKGEALKTSMSATQSLGGSVTFHRVDVRDYQAQLGLFDAAFQEHGRVDYAISCAAVNDPPGWFEPEALDLESVKKVCHVHPLVGPRGGGTTLGDFGDRLKT